MSAVTYEPVIGLETHVQLSTQSKLFCSCPNRFGAPPNSLTCPVCSGRPGTLPALNEQALELGLLVGLAFQGEIPEITRFDRKNYFYPDLPKGYQISQLDQPVCLGGRVPVSDDGAVIALERVHLEEDAGKSLHDHGPYSLIDLNRAGVPLLEIVTKPVIQCAEQAATYLHNLRDTMRYLGVSDCDMEKGSLRCDVNVSVRPVGSEVLGTKVEVKNLNSFRMIGRAIEHEIKRQTALLEAGETVAQETRLWDDERGLTATMRGKEDAHDYRYFPEPDLPEFAVARAHLDELRRNLPEMPLEKRRRFRDRLGLSAYDTDGLTTDPKVAAYFEELTACGAAPKPAANWVLNRVLQYLNQEQKTIDQFPLGADRLSGLIERTERGVINKRTAENVFEAMIEQGHTADEVIAARGLEQIQDAAQLEEICRTVMNEKQGVVEQILAGKDKARLALVGQVMKATRGRADPKLVQDTLTRLIDERRS